MGLSFYHFQLALFIFYLFYIILDPITSLLTHGLGKADEGAVFPGDRQVGTGRGWGKKWRGRRRRKEECWESVTERWSDERMREAEWKMEGEESEDTSG